MLLSRSAALAQSLSTLATSALVRPALAARKSVNMDKGIVFERKDGSQGIAWRQKGSDVVIACVTNRGDWLDRRRVTKGVFEIGRVVRESEFPLVGASAPNHTWTYSPTPVWPEDGLLWSGKVREVSEVTISDANATVQRDRTRRTASYRCFDPRKVKLLGYTYQVLTVEATIVGDRSNRTRRWAFFPEISLGLQTRCDGVTNGITALTPA
jgi:hypothetical protein